MAQTVARVGTPGLECGTDCEAVREGGSASPGESQQGLVASTECCGKRGRDGGLPGLERAVRHVPKQDRTVSVDDALQPFNCVHRLFVNG